MAVGPTDESVAPPARRRSMLERGVEPASEEPGRSPAVTVRPSEGERRAPPMAEGSRAAEGRRGARAERGRPCFRRDRVETTVYKPAHKSPRRDRARPSPVRESAATTINLRLGLAIFQVGFAVEAAGGFATLLSLSLPLPSPGTLPLLSLAFSACGILFLVVGRREWNDLHLARIRYASLLFFATLVAGAAAALVVAAVVVGGNASPAPAWAGAFGTSVAAALALGFGTYALVVAHLVGRPGEVAIGVGIGWSIVVAVEVGSVLATHLGAIARAASGRTPAIASVFGPVRDWEALLAFSYLAFLYAFSEAHHRVARGPTPELPV